MKISGYLNLSFFKILRFKLGDLKNHIRLRLHQMMEDGGASLKKLCPISAKLVIWEGLRQIGFEIDPILLP